MLKKVYRLKRNSQFSYMYKHGELKHAKALSLVYIKTKIQPFKIGITVGKKVGNAVHRNLIKRRLRAIFAENFDKLDKAHNYIVIAREGITDVSFADLKVMLESLLKKANLIHE